ncbi:hypothetical protein F751_2042 [Auxenochlorella protothecoides]|uniref:Uncharacterized protein n=1 Tax=Auxenochlorella protothecoides TaxID=3075 RepID=A0A087SMK2_AUXPR|nr:hypothetical protein F751_2042 [Auxenochlorella protothecoides]KFM26956.1 hypothetical protein F751_2042 [Auxenochlorella protothecoides]
MALSFWIPALSKACFSSSETPQVGVMSPTRPAEGALAIRTTIWSPEQQRDVPGDAAYFSIATPPIHLSLNAEQNSLSAMSCTSASLMHLCIRGLVAACVRFYWDAMLRAPLCQHDASHLLQDHTCCSHTLFQRGGGTLPPSCTCDPRCFLGP